MLYKKLNQIKQCIDEGLYQQASNYIVEIIPEVSSGYSEFLLNKYSSLLPKEFVPKNEPLYSDGLLSDYDSRDLIPGVSIVSCCMNRNANLKKALKTWVKLAVDEIIIVDWSSSESVFDTVSEFNDTRIKILRVNNERKWVLSYGFNVGLRFSSYSKVFKLDADIEVSEDFLSINQFGPKQFVRGYWKSAIDEGLDSQIYVNGSYGCYKKELLSIGFYNELIRTYGWDDSDLYERLASEAGLETKYLSFKSLLHLDQEEAERVSNQDVLTDSFLGVIPATEFNNQRNKFIGRTTDYWGIGRLQNYSIARISEQLWSCERVSKDIPIPGYLISDANIYASIRFMWIHVPEILSKCLSVTDAAKLVFNEYSENVIFASTKNLLGQGDNPFELTIFDAQYESFEKFIHYCLGQVERCNKNLFAVALAPEYKHDSIGVSESSLEIITMPKELLKEVVNARQYNQVQNVDIEKCKWISEGQYSSVLEPYRRKCVYIDAQHGLGNRLRAIGSAAAIAEKSGRELVIVWEPDHHCECRFVDLFDYSGLVIESSFLVEANKKMCVYNYMEIEDGAFKGSEIEIDSKKDIYLRSAYTLNSPFSDWETENKFIKQLLPSVEIRDFVKDFDLDHTVAAHVRMEAGEGFDHNTYDSIENWTQEGHDQLYFWREKSHYSHFIKRIDELLDENENLKLFLATDLPETYKIFEDYYGDKLLYLKRDVYDRSKEQMKYALADAILLSKSQKLLGSTWSSFSELAMRLSTTYSSIEMSGRDF